jgi:hypothetical protein
MADPASAAISGGITGLVDLFGGLAAAAQRRKEAEMQGSLKAADTQMQAEGGSAQTQADRERMAFENMMNAYGRSLT